MFTMKQLLCLVNVLEYIILLEIATSLTGFVNGAAIDAFFHTGESAGKSNDYKDRTSYHNSMGIKTLDTRRVNRVHGSTSFLSQRAILDDNTVETEHPENVQRIRRDASASHVQATNPPMRRMPLVRYQGRTTQEGRGHIQKPSMMLRPRDRQYMRVITSSVSYLRPRERQPHSTHISRTRTRPLGRRPLRSPNEIRQPHSTHISRTRTRPLGRRPLRLHNEIRQPHSTQIPQRRTRRLQRRPLGHA